MAGAMHALASNAIRVTARAWNVLVIAIVVDVKSALMVVFAMMVQAGPTVHGLTMARIIPAAEQMMIALPMNSATRASTIHSGLSVTCPVETDRHAPTDSCAATSLEMAFAAAPSARHPTAFGVSSGAAVS